MPLRIDTWDDIPGAIGLMQQAGAGHRVPILQALYHGRIAHLEVQRTGSTGLSKRWSAIVRLPALALIGDDDHASSDGPGTWPVAARLFRWARFVLIHGGAGQPEHYALAVALAEKHGRLVMVECSSANIQAWHDAAAKWVAPAQVHTLRHPEGVLHPSLDTARMQ